ncbi:hypothetical protein C0966_17330 (plasmid) [Bacillus methanolicus]|uniref:hypothetical protein n=1 Tax=Bacillus methanolicus TaxID=1471 RepID=UPI0023802B5A|nr:hypothetical protein [Bacillus methanolicus]MDE3841028.1 hypothetical protein [Bacillus methanolicus]
MKKWLILLLIMTMIFMMGACSSKEKKSTFGDVKVTGENKSYLEEYDKALQGYINEMTNILKTFNNALDGIYTQKYSRSQFTTALTASIEKSNKLVTEVEAYDVKPELFEAHQNLIVLVNRSHQLLLDAIDMANQEDSEIEKDVLRNTYLEIKKEQANIANQWKILREELQAAEEGKKK